MATTQEQLDEINRAITAVVERGQRYKIGDREVWRADMEWLTAERDRLTRAVQLETRGGVRIRRVIPLC